MDRSIERDVDPGTMGRRDRDNPEGAEWRRPIDERFYDRGSRYDQADYRRNRGSDFEYEERYRPRHDFRLERTAERMRERRMGRPGHERPEDVYERRFEPGRFAGTNTYGGESGDPMRGPHAGRGPAGYRRSDDAIREDVCQRLCDHGWIDASDVQVRVEDGEVTLEGTVERREEKRLAYDVADAVRGVRDVHNRIVLRAPGEAPKGRPRQGGKPEARPEASDDAGNGAGNGAASRRPTTAW